VPRLSIIPLKQDLSWQQILANTINNTAELCSFLDLEDKLDSLPEDHPLLQQFPLRVPAPYLGRIERGNLRDPLLLQVFPGASEADAAPGYHPDPLEEAASNPEPGVLHKYQGRALLLVTSSCAIHCRYCFRRHFPYNENLPGRQHWKQSLAYIKEDTSISEVIFSGGDPLTLPDTYLEWFLEELSNFEHIKRIRLHTRLPIMIPQRITSSLVRILANPRFQTILVVHCNHAQEFDSAVDHACQLLKQAGITLLNQSVLLSGINDSATALINLSQRLFEAGILPYYLHMLDKVTGAAHFEVDEAAAIELMRALQNALPGYLVPKLVRELPGEAAKTPVL